MLLQPVLEHEASNSVSQNYNSIKSALDLPRLPLFFSYIGAFPEYLDYITHQLTENLNNPQFRSLHSEVSTQIQPLLHDSLPKSLSLDTWISRYNHTPSWYYLQKDVQKTYETNVKLAFIFMGLREAVKGWAVAAKKLQDHNTTSEKQTQSGKTPQQDQFIFDEIIQISEPTNGNNNYQNNPEVLTTNHQSLATIPQSSIEINLYPEYMRLCRNDFGELMKKEEFWIVRASLEKVFLSSLNLLPNLIFSPINVVLELTKKYDSFPDLLYLLTEHFPTYAMQRMMFSGYMKE